MLTEMFQFALEKTRKQVCRSRQLEIGSNDDMKFSKRHVTFKSLIFLLKWFSKFFFAGNYQKNALSVGVDKKSSFIFVLNLVPRTLEIACEQPFLSGELCVTSRKTAANWRLASNRPVYFRDLCTRCGPICHHGLTLTHSYNPVT